MTHKIEINISEVIENSNNEEKELLFKEFFSTILNDNSRSDMLTWLLNDRKECEIEFGKRKDVIDAYNTVMDTVSEY